MPDNLRHSDLRPGTDEYAEHIREEIQHYGRIYQEAGARKNLMQPVPPAWIEAETRAAKLIRYATGNDVLGHLLERLRRVPGARMLSLGSGPGGIELELARHVSDAATLCMDINPELLRLGRERAETEGLNVQFVEADLNTVDLPMRDFDVVFCHAALHHVIELERLMEEIARTLRPGGFFLTVDVVTRNGYLMWPETRDVVSAIWKTLPARFRVNHATSAGPLIDDEIWEADTRAAGMECARSEAIFPAIAECFEVAHYVPYFSLSRRFFDTMYGPSYDLTAPLDRAVFDWIWEMDVHHLATGLLRPETFFGMYRPALRPRRPPQNFSCSMQSIEEIVAETSAWKPPAYLPVYARLFEPVRRLPLVMLELGIHEGGSLKAWEAYFPAARIAGLDFRPPVIDVGDRVRMFAGDQADCRLLSRIAAEMAPDGFDLIIDDCSHIGALSKVAFWHLFDNHLKPGGFYCIEDWGTGYLANWPDGRESRVEPDTDNRMPSHDAGMVGFVKQLVDELHAHMITEGRPSKFADIALHTGLCIITKVAAPNCIRVQGETSHLVHLWPASQCES
jgi:SAM-dependent methyltransferase